MTRIVVIADTHGFHRALGKLSGDVLIHAGDFMVSGTDQREALDFNDWLGQQDFKFKLVISGNHDILFERWAVMMKQVLTHAIYLEDSGVYLDGRFYWGSPWTPRFFDWSFNADRGADIRQYWDRIPSNTEVLITHGPPMNVLDYSHFGNAHVGCADLAEAVTRIKPKLHVFGHIHAAYGRQVSSDTEFINAAICNEAYRPANVPQVYDLA